MCGIAAIFAYAASAPGVNEPELVRIRDHMAARGPDGAGSWCEPQQRVGLAHRRLAIIDPSAGGAQPMRWDERQLVITFNGEIYNYRALRKELETRGHVFRSTSDTEVLLHLYADRGDAMVEELRGMYAFAIWDGRQRGLFLARDPLGIKPLYFADDGRTLRAASQVKALLAGGGVSTASSPAGQVGFFLWGHVPEPFTLFQGIRSLPAGTTLWLDERNERREKRFFSVRETFAQATASGTRESAPEAVREALRDSVAHHLVADVPVGVFLSSGLDSTTLAALAAEQGGRLRTVTLGFEEYRGTPDDEVPLAEQLARQYGTEHQTVWVGRREFEAHVERLFHAMDQPTTDGANTYFVSLAASLAGLKVALSGLGGDELFGGYPSFRQIPRSVRLFNRLSFLDRLGKPFRIASAPIVRRLTSPKYAGVLEYGGTYSGSYLLRRGMFMPWEIPGLLGRDVFTAGWEELQSIPRLQETIRGLRNPRAKVSTLEMDWYMRNQLLRDSDWAGMAHSLEIRVPFVDHALLRRLAPVLNGSQPPSKLDMAKSPAQPLPPALLSRPKTGFQIPIRRWLMVRQASGSVYRAERGLRGWARYLYDRLCRAGDSAPALGQVLVLVSDAFGGRGGIAKFNRDLLNALCADKNIGKVCALPRLLGEHREPLPPKLDFLTHSAGAKMRFMWSAWLASFRNPCPELILCGHINLLPAAFLAHLVTRAPVVLFLHGIEAWQPPRNWILTKLAARVHAAVSVSDLTRRRFLAWSRLSSGVDFILPNSVDLERFQPGLKASALQQRYGLAKKVVLLTVGRLVAAERYKGVDEVLESLPELGREINNLAYLIVGEGDDRRRLMQKARSLGLQVTECLARSQLSRELPADDKSPAVIFAGYVPDSELPDHYRLADAFVLPGRGEGFGIVYLEALACGTPIVASSADASSELVAHTKRIAVAQPENPASIRAAIRRALEMGTGEIEPALRRFAVGEFDRRCAEIVHDLRTRLLQRHRRKVLVFRIGQLGDTIVALPAIWAIRRHLPDAEFTLLCDRHPGKPRVLAADLLRGTGAFDHFLSYAVDQSQSGKLLRMSRMSRLLLSLRRRRFDCVVYLSPSGRLPEQVQRDRRFFAAAGIREFFGFNGFTALPARKSGSPLPQVAAESDLLLKRLAVDGVKVPKPGEGSLDLCLGETEQVELSAWLAKQGTDAGRPWLGIGPGSKMPAKRWAEERFQEVVRQLIARHNLWPVIFGGPEDAEIATRLLAAWGCGYSAAGELSLRAAAAGLARCRTFLGNDTGTMHLAAAVGTPCIAIFSARAHPGMWSPYGVESRVLRSQIDCEGCMLDVCRERKNECLNRISIGEVLAVANDLLSRPAREPRRVAENISA